MMMNMSRNLMVEMIITKQKIRIPLKLQPKKALNKKTSLMIKTSTLTLILKKNLTKTTKKRSKKRTNQFRKMIQTKPNQ